MVDWRDDPALHGVAWHHPSMLEPRYPYYLANAPVFANEALAVTDKFTGELVARVALADAEAIDAGITAGTR